MTIAIDATVVREPLSGVHYAVRGQALALLRMLPAGDLLVLATDPVLRQAAERAGCRCPPLPQRLRQAGWRILWQQTQLPKVLLEHHCKVLLALSYTAPRNCPIPVVLQVHDTIALDQPELCSRKNAMHFKALLPQSMKNADRIVVPSSFVRDQVIRHSGKPDSLVHRLPLAIDDAFRQPAAALPDDLDHLPPYFLFVGNIEPKKGVDILLDAYCRLDGATKLVLVGRDGWKCGSTVRRIERYDGPGRLVRLGYVDRRLLPALYANARACVLPSLVEGFGLPVLEAMAVNCPVIHSDHPALSETANGFGRAFPVRDADALADLLREPAPCPPDARAYARSMTWDHWARELNRVQPL